MNALPAPAREHAETALRWLDEMPRENNPQARRQLVAVMQELVQSRDELIALQRAGEPCGEWLRRANAVLSSIFGTEFPVNGLSLTRVSETRDALRRMLTDEGGESRWLDSAREA